MRVFKAWATAIGILTIAACVCAEPVIFGYYDMKLKDQTNGADFSMYTHINLGFGAPGPDGDIAFSEEYMLPGVPQEIKASGAKVLISLGGWQGSGNFSTIMKSKDASANLIDNIVSVIEDNKLDGVDILWEYPGQSIYACFESDATNDVPNFLQFLKSLREGLTNKFKDMEKLITISLPAKLYSYDGGDKYYSEFADVVDYAHIMAFNVNGISQPTTGPYAPFYADTRGIPNSFVWAINNWVNAGWPANQLTAGISFEGRAAITTKDMTTDLTNQYQEQNGPLQCDYKAVCPYNTAITNPCDQSSIINDKWQYKYLRKGILNNGNGSPDYARQWDNTSMTHWLYNSTHRFFFTYDDPDSVKVKIDYAAQNNLAGAAVWEIHMDFENELLNTIHSWPESSSESNSDAPVSSDMYSESFKSAPSHWENQQDISWVSVSETSSAPTSEKQTDNNNDDDGDNDD